MLRRLGFSVSPSLPRPLCLVLCPLSRRASHAGEQPLSGSRQTGVLRVERVTINGIPLHPLIVHAAVVLVPLAALFAILYAVLPARRWQTRTSAVVLAIGAALAVQLASMTGDQLKENLNENTALIHTHEQWAGLLQAAMWVLAALMVIGWWALPHENPLPDQDHREGVSVLAKPLVVLLPVAAVAVMVLVVLTGDAGARAVWGHGGRNGTAVASVHQP
jgi:uncharacterized membrane protein